MTVLPRAWPARAWAIAIGASLSETSASMCTRSSPVAARRASSARSSGVGLFGVVAAVLGQAEGGIGLIRVQPGILQRVGVELVVQADAAALLAQVEQDAADVVDAFDGLPQLRAAVTAGRAEHVPGQALGV